MTGVQQGMEYEVMPPASESRKMVDFAPITYKVFWERADRRKNIEVSGS